MQETHRQIVLDTETTGIDPQKGHRIIEIGCVEMINRKLTGNNFHVYINPERIVEQEAIDIHGIDNDFLQDKPVFAQIADDFIDYIRDAELVIHNAPFDVGFMDHEFSLLNPVPGRTLDFSTVFDTLAYAREKFPGQRNSLDALCKRFDIDNSHRTLHGALLDSEILADVYLMMTGGQRKLGLYKDGDSNADSGATIRRLDQSRPPLNVVRAAVDEEKSHQQYLSEIKENEGKCLWLSDT